MAYQISVTEPVFNALTSCGPLPRDAASYSQLCLLRFSAWDEPLGSLTKIWQSM